jgi:hypothetical protein
MNDRRLLRLRQLAQGAALLGVTTVLPSCETPRAAAPTPPSDTGKPVEVAAAPAPDAGDPPFRTPAQLNAPRPRVTMDPQEAKEAEKAALAADAGAALPPPTGVILNAPPNSKPIEPVPSKVHLNAPRRPDAGTPSGK